jgi:hypothetical protein
MGQQRWGSGSRPDPFNGPAQEKDADPTTQSEHLGGSRGEQRSARHERPWGNCIGQHSRRNSKEKFGAKRYRSQGSDEGSIRVCPSIGKVGQVEPDKHRARSTGNAHQAVAQQRDRKAVTRADQGCGVCTGVRPIFHNHRLDGSTVSGNKSSNLTENVGLGKPL